MESPQVTELHLVRCSRKVIETAIKAIGRPLHSSGLRQPVVNGIGGSSGTLVLPNLCKLFITDETFSGKVKGEDIVDMLEALYMGRRSRGRFRLVVDSENFWDDRKMVLRRLKRLVKDGFDLEVVTGLQRLDLV
jgi:hypothetical protein